MAVEGICPRLTGEAILDGVGDIVYISRYLDMIIQIPGNVKPLFYFIFYVADRRVKWYI
jgi:hypothetical protein